MSNPLLKDFDTPPFEQIENIHYLPAIQEAITKAKIEIETIINNIASPTFNNTVEALEYSGKQLSKVTSVFFNLNSAETNDEIQQIAQEVSPLLSEFRNDITLNIDLFEKVKQVYNSEIDTLQGEQKRLLEKHYKSFTRNGALLMIIKRKL